MATGGIQAGNLRYATRVIHTMALLARSHILAGTEINPSMIQRRLPAGNNMLAGGWVNGGRGIRVSLAACPKCQGKE
jgi:hypothetical protein